MIRFMMMILIIVGVVFSQQESSCDQLLSFEEDIVTGNKIRGSKTFLLVTEDTKTGFAICMSITPESDVLILSMKVYGGGGCLDDDETVSIVFTDTTRVQFKVDNSFNCDQKATIYFGGVFGDKKKVLDPLLTKHIKVMRVSTMKESVTETFTEDQAERFRRTFQCVYELSNISK